MDLLALSIGTVGGAIALFVSNAIAWMALHHHKADFRRIGGRAGAISDAVADAGLGPGMYPVPHMEDFERQMSDPIYLERLERGPNFLLVVAPTGNPMSGRTFARGFLVNLLEALGCALLMSIVAPLGGVSNTVLFFVAVGAFKQLATYLSLSVWMWFPPRFALTSTCDAIVGYALVGLVLYFVGPGS